MDQTQKIHITLAGKLNDGNFQKCLACVRYLEQTYPKEFSATVHQFFETQWEEYLKKVQSEKKGQFYQHKQSPLIFCNESQYIGETEAFMDWVLCQYRYIDKSSMLIYKKKATDAMKQLIDNTTGRQYVYLDVDVNGSAQKVIFELFQDLAPQTCENFRKLCQGTTNAKGEKIGYVGSEFHRVVKGMYIQGGDIKSKGKFFNLDFLDGSSIYGSDFGDESFHVKHTEIGLLGMCKKKGFKHTNECQFYVTVTAPLSFMDGKYVIFGRVISGMRALKLMEKMETLNERPKAAVKITGAGDYNIGKKI